MNWSPGTADQAACLIPMSSSAESTPGIAIPFYLAHPRLMRLNEG
jgi:hypothetical protein